MFYRRKLESGQSFFVSGNYNRKDHYYLQAKAEGYRSRAAYKLIELDQKYRLLKTVSKIVDLGCAPGGWLQVAAKKIGPQGFLIGVDLEPVDPLQNCQTMVGDFTEESVRTKIKSLVDGKVDLVLSDMSPHLSGIRFQDAARSAELVQSAADFAKDVLFPGGNFVAKIFPGVESDMIFKELRNNFQKVSRCCLKSSRKTSTEFYLVASGYKK